MKKFLVFSLLSSSFFLSTPKAIADWDSWGYTRSSGTTGASFYKIDSETGDKLNVFTYTDKTKFFDTTYQSWYSISNLRMNTANGNIEYKSYENCPGKTAWYEGTSTDPNCTSVYEKWYSVNLNEGTRTEISTPWHQSYTSIGDRPAIIRRKDGSITLEQNGEAIIGKKNNGEIHLGENSWITKEENGRQKVYAKDAAGNAIPIDYTNGTKLLINGRDVEQSINNVGALSAALTGLPTVPTDTTLACGLGTGTHGGDFAFSGGCASRVNDKLSINYAASMTMPGQDYAGDFEDTFSARAGFVWQLGKSTKPSQISMKTQEKMEEKIYSLEEKNQNLENTVSTLMAKLEHLEKLALGEYKPDDLATIKLP